MFKYEKLSKGDVRMGEIYRLRFKVYCLECGYEDPCDYQDGLERDLFDPVSTHFAVSDHQAGKIIGTVRIIRHSEIGLPVVNHFPIENDSVAHVSPENIGEVSRLAISKEYRCHLVDKVCNANKQVFRLKEKRDAGHWRRRLEFELVTGLYHCVYEASVELGLTHLYAIMSDRLYVLLQRRGLKWKPVGPARDYHGIRRPFVGSIEENREWFEGRQAKVAGN